MQFDEQLKKHGVTLEESSRICRGAPASGDSPIDGYWSCLCDKPLLRNTGRPHCLTLHSAVYRPSLCLHRARFSPHMPRPIASAFQLRTSTLPRHTVTFRRPYRPCFPRRHTVTFRILSKENEGRSGGWAVVGMASPASSKGSGPGGADDSVGGGSDGTSSVGPCLRETGVRVSAGARARARVPRALLLASVLASASI